MRRLALAALLALAACAHTEDAPRAQFDPPSAPDTPYGHDPGTALGTAASAAVMQAGTGAKPARPPCGGGCAAGQYCDTRSGVDRCVKDVLPAAAQPAR